MQPTHRRTAKKSTYTGTKNTMEIAQMSENKPFKVEGIELSADTIGQYLLDDSTAFIKSFKETYYEGQEPGDNTDEEFKVLERVLKTGFERGAISALEAAFFGKPYKQVKKLKNSSAVKEFDPNNETHVKGSLIMRSVKYIEVCSCRNCEITDD